MKIRTITLVMLTILATTSVHAGSYKFSDIVSFPNTDNRRCSTYPEIITSTNIASNKADKVSTLNVTLNGIFPKYVLATTFILLGSNSTGISLPSPLASYNLAPQIHIKIRTNSTNRKYPSYCFLNIK